MRHHLRADAIRLRGRWDLRAFLLLVPLLAAFGYVEAYGSVALRVGGDPSEPVPPEIATQVAAQLAAEHAAFAFPHSLLTVFDNAPWVLFGVFFLASATIGLEFGWGTVRTALISSPDRARLVASRVVAIGIVGLVALALLALVGLLMPALMRAAGTELPPSPDTPWQMLAAVGVASVVEAGFVISFGTLLAVLTRSPAMPILLLILDFLVEGVVASWPSVRSAGLDQLAGSLPVNRLIRLSLGARDPAAFGLPPEAVPSPTADRPLALSFAVAIGWTAAFLLVAGWRMRRMDIQE